MRFGDVVAPALRSARLRGRRVWAGGERAHIEVQVHGVPPQAVCAALEAAPGVRWAKPHPPLGRVVVAYDWRRADPEELAQRVARLERDLRVVDLHPRRDHLEHPGDIEPWLVASAELLADAAGLWAGLLLRGLRAPRLGAEVDLAALLRSLDSIPAARRLLERRLGVVGMDVALALLGAASQALLQAWSGPVLDASVRALRARELWARRVLWERREPELCADAAAYPAAPPAPAPRPRPIPDGPVESYSEKAVVAALGAFGLGVTATRSIEQSAAALFGGLPTPAVLGREAFTAHLAYRLAERDVLVLDRRRLAVLDRVDWVAVDAGLLAHPPGGGPSPAMTHFVRAARRAGVSLAVLAAGARDVSWCRAERVYDGPADGAVRALQETGGVVLYIGAGPDLAYDQADLGLGLTHQGRTAWGAQLLGRRGLDDATFLVDAAGRARWASRQSVDIAVLELCASAVVALAGLRPGTTRQVMQLANIGAMLAVANGLRQAQRSRGLPATALRDPTPWHALDTAAVLQRLGSASHGLGETTAARRRRPVRQPSALGRFARLVFAELRNPLAPILAAGAGLSAVVGSLGDSVLIGSVLGVNALVGGSQRYRIERLLLRLNGHGDQRVRVRRGGRVHAIDAQQLVMGDVVELEAGEVVCGDCRILEAEGLEVDESSLTGESLPVPKSSAPSSAAAVAERSSMIYDGTTVASGHTVAVVVAVGDDVEAQGGTGGDDDHRPHTGVEARLERLTSLTTPVVLTSGLLVAALGLMRGRPAQEVVASGVSLAVAAVPEGLPVLATLAQLAAAARLSRRGVLVRNPRAVEALGRVQVLCADKTGTLTEGQMRLARVCDGTDDHQIEGLPASHRDVVATGRRASPSSRGRLPHVTDRALIEGAQELGIASARGGRSWRRLAELQFEAQRGYHAVLGEAHGACRLSVKGAPEVVLPRCDRWLDAGAPVALDPRRRHRLQQRAAALAERGLRVLAVAERDAAPARRLDDAAVDHLMFRGFLAFADRVRPSARRALDELRRAGVEALMITGDHPSTAAAVAADVGLAAGRVLTGPELDALDDDALAERLRDTRVVARVTPAQKVRIVRGLQRAGKVVAMAGDGANDAAAIRLADVGIALGPRATAASRSSADIVVGDDRIEVVVQAVLEGRALWSSVRDAVAILVGGNLGEIGFTVGAATLTGRSPLNPRQLILVNLLTDALPSLAVALRQPRTHSADQILDEGPDASLGSALTRNIAWRAAITGSAAGGAWLAARLFGRNGADTVALLALIGAQLGQTLVAGGRSPLVWGASLGSAAALLAVVQTPGLSHFFGCRPLGPIGLAQAGAATVAATGAAMVAPWATAKLEAALGPQRLGRLRHHAWVRPVLEQRWWQSDWLGAQPG